MPNEFVVSIVTFNFSVFENEYQKFQKYPEYHLEGYVKCRYVKHIYITRGLKRQNFF